MIYLQVHGLSDDWYFSLNIPLSWIRSPVNRAIGSTVQEYKRLAPENIAEVEPQMGNPWLLNGGRWKLRT